MQCGERRRRKYSLSLRWTPLSRQLPTGNKI
jgi:hypothetical protein